MAQFSGDVPTITDVAHAHTVYGGLGQVGTAGGFVPMSTTAGTMQSQWTTAGGVGAILPQGVPDFGARRLQFPSQKEAKPMAQDKAALVQGVGRRLVQVFIADPNENIPLEHCLLYTGEQKITDATDQELFFEIDIKQVLAKHNEKRITFVDKKVKERTEHLEPAKVRDLNMVVVTVAQF